jgi:transcriptional regulator with XRE-family HTH domain
MRTKLQLLADRGAEARCRTIAEELRRLREDAGLSKAAVARVAGIHPSHLGLVESGRREPSASVLGRIAAALGADVSTRIFQSVGPPIRDRFQSRMIEAFLRMLPSHWARFVEVPVHRPVRGVLDAVVGDRVARRVVSIEGQSELRRLEQQFRWASAKSDALPSSAVWPFLAPDPADPRRCHGFCCCDRPWRPGCGADIPRDPLRRVSGRPSRPRRGPARLLATVARERHHLGSSRRRADRDPPRLAERDLTRACGVTPSLELFGSGWGPRPPDASWRLTVSISRVERPDLAFGSWARARKTRNGRPSVKRQTREACGEAS